MIAVWTILHGIVAIALLGAVTHQGLTVWRKPATAELFINRFRAVPAPRFTTTIIVLYVLTFVLGAYIYPTYVLDVKPSLAESGMRKTVGLFQLKEHIAVIGLALLPAYWHFWRGVPLTATVWTRQFLTTFLMLGVWWNLVIGHILNNVKGLS
jgi:hypothetical protein